MCIRLATSFSTTVFSACLSPSYTRHRSSSVAVHSEAPVCASRAQRKCTPKSQNVLRGYLPFAMVVHFDMKLMEWNAI